MGKLVDIDVLFDYFGNDAIDETTRSNIEYFVSEKGTVKAIPKANVYKAIQEMMKYEHEGENFVEPRTGEWIPVRERLPEESDNYLVTNDDGDVEMAYFAHPKDYTISKGEWREIWCEDDVIAWMPLPKPYKAESEDEG